MIVTIPVSIGELVDKITILQIKQQHITDNDKLKNISMELTSLLNIFNGLNQLNLGNLQAELQQINQDLWKLEEFKRCCEQDQIFDDEFVSAARQVYIKNDLRAAIKRQINLAMGSDIIEEKSYNL